MKTHSPSAGTRVPRTILLRAALIVAAAAVIETTLAELGAGGCLAGRGRHFGFLVAEGQRTRGRRRRPVARRSPLEGRQEDVPLRHLRRRGVLGRHAPAAPGDRRRSATAASVPASAPRPRWRSASRSTSTRSPSSLAERPHGTGSVNLDDPADHARAAEAQRGRRRDGLLRRDGQLRSIGIQCALCHSTVDDSFAPGIGHRLDGWANRDLNVGAIIALAPDLSVVDATCSASTRRPCARCSHSWGPGQVRRRAVPRRQGVPARRQDRGDADPAGVRSRRASTSTPGPAGARVTALERASSPTSRCTARGRSSTRG